MHTREEIMRVAIVGTGSLGTIIGAFISQAGKQVDLIDAYIEHVDTLNQFGATITGAIERNVPVNAITPNQMEGTYDLVFLLTKQTANKETLTQLLPYLHDESMVCTLQNGIPEYSVAEIIGQERTLGGAVRFGATWVKPGVSALTSDYQATKNFAFEIGELDGVIRPRLEVVREYLECVGHTEIRSDLLAIRYTKVLMNASFSGMSAALGCTFGEILNDPKAMVCLAFVVDECIKVAHAHGIQLISMSNYDFNSFELDNAQDIPSKMPLYRKIWGAHTALKASMLQDLEKGKDTEIQYINGLICEKGRERNIPTPFNDKIVELVTEAQKRRGVNDFSYLSRFDELLKQYADDLPGQVAWPE